MIHGVLNNSPLYGKGGRHMHLVIVLGFVSSVCVVWFCLYIHSTYILNFYLNCMLGLPQQTTYRIAGFNREELIIA